MDDDTLVVELGGMGGLAVTVPLYVIGSRRRWWRVHPELLIRDPDGGEQWIAPGDRVDLHVTIKVI